MDKILNVLKLAAFIILPLMLALSACTSAPTTPPATYNLWQLKYQLIAKYPDIFWCDPDYYPISREGQEQANALEQFPTIQANQEEFSAILKQLNMQASSSYTDAEKLEIYRQHKKLTYPVQTAATDNGYNFTLRVGEGQGKRIEGTITSAGVIRVTKQEDSINTCPICLAKGTLIDTPSGPVPVEQLVKGMAVWTVDESGNRVAAVVEETTMTPVPESFKIIEVTLSDGRMVNVSPGHPAADGRSIEDYRVGDTLDGAQIVSLERISYEGFTYDLLPSGSTGLYRANGILLKSTLATPEIHH